MRKILFVIKFNLMILNKIAKSFVTIMIVIAVCALLLRIGIEQIIKINIAQDESSAIATIKLISAALENYAADHKGAYPAVLSSLTQTNPAYLDKDYIAQSSLKGYSYACGRLEASGYSCQAVPVKCNFTGRAVYSVTTGGVVASQDCSK